MGNNILRDFKAHAKRAGITFNGAFTIHTFRKSCAQNWADRLPANVVRFYLGHSSMDTTNRFCRIVDDSHAAWTRAAMDAMLSSGSGSALDTGQTLASQNAEKTDTRQVQSSTDTSVTPPTTSSCPRHQEWAMQDSDLRPPACKAGALAN
jgi:glycerol dehydrogenase-like iron-containing ADH family enzyme